MMEEKIATNEAMEEMRNKVKDIIQKQITKNPTVKSNASKVAIEVATPLPPLKSR